MKQRLAIAAAILQQAKLPNIPNEVATLQDESMKPDPDVVVISRCISRNPKLLTKFLAVASFMSKKEISTARQAVDILGTKGVFTVFFSSAIEFSFESSGDSALIVNHAIKIAMAMAELSAELKEFKASDAYLFGLLYNMGYVVLNRYNPDSYKSFYLANLMTPSQSAEKELAFYGTTSHCIGVYVAKKWRVKNAIYSGILLQQSAIEPCAKGENLAYELTNLLNIARAVVAETEDTRYITPEIRQNAQAAMQRLNIGQRAYLKAQQKVKRLTKDLASFPKTFLPAEDQEGE